VTPVGLSAARSAYMKRCLLPSRTRE